MSALSTTSKSSQHTRRTSGRVQQRIEQLENNVTTTGQSKPIPITLSKNFYSRKQLNTITSPTTTSSSQTPRRNRTKSKMEIFDDVYEQLEQLDELYFENMSFDDTLSSSPVIQFDNLSSEPSSMIPNLHVRMNSLMSRHEYETKRELICQQYYNAESDDETNAISDHSTIDTDNLVQKSNQYLDSNLYKFSYLELKNKFPKGVKESEKEQYLTDDEFLIVFGMNRGQFQSLGEYKRRRLKIAKGLF